ncbi:MAG: hypothetical protein Q6373_024475 [Candidatus Sigynarchaeota archaeon]
MKQKLIIETTPVLATIKRNCLACALYIPGRYGDPANARCMISAMACLKPGENCRRKPLDDAEARRWVPDWPGVEPIIERLRDKHVPSAHTDHALVILENRSCLGQDWHPAVIPFPGHAKVRLTSDAVNDILKAMGYHDGCRIGPFDDFTIARFHDDVRIVREYMIKRVNLSRELHKQRQVVQQLFFDCFSLRELQKRYDDVIELHSVTDKIEKLLHAARERLDAMERELLEEW